MRRGRLNADSWQSSEIPLEEPVEAYRLDILDGETVMRSLDTTAAWHDYGAADEIADFGAPQTAIGFRVRQKGQTIPLGVAAQTVAAL